MSTWYKACELEDLKKKKLCRINLDSIDILVAYADNGNIWAFENRCSHADKRLDLGQWDAKESLITCPFHKSTFDLKDGGRSLNPPAVTSLILYETRCMTPTDSPVWVEVKLDSL